MTRPLRRRLVLATALAAAFACGRGPSYGSANAIIAVVDPGIREEVEPILRQGLEREVVTTRPEKIFEVTFTTPAEIGDFRRWRRLVVVEPLTDPVLVPDLVDVPREGAVVAETTDEWARGQTIHVLAAGTPEATIDLVAATVDSLFREIHADYVEHQVARMWASGRDSALFERLIEERGFGVVLPRVYRPAPASAPDSSLVFYNEEPRRVVSLHWRPRPPEMTPDTVLAVRRSWGGRAFPDEEIVGSLEDGAGASPDTLAPAGPPIEAGVTELAGRRAVRLRGTWRERDGVSAGLFLTYGLACGERLVLLDGNVYAPDRGKYPYLIQLERIFATFACAGP